MKVSFKKPPRVGLDIDGVLRDLPNSFFMALKKGGHLSPLEPCPAFDQYELHKCFDMKPETLNHLLYQDDFVLYETFALGAAYPGAMKFLRQLSRVAEIALCTKQTPLSWGCTLYWIAETLPIEHISSIDVCFIGSGKEKHAFAYDILIDDCPKNVDLFLKTGRKACLLSRPWNTNTGLPTVFSYNDAIQFVRDSS